jgi:phosphoglycerate kinase
VLPSAAGRLFEEELRVLTRVRDQPDRPCLFLLGGAKILDAFKMMRAALESGTADHVLTAGLTGEIMLIAAGHDPGKATTSLLEEKHLLQFVEPARELLGSFADRLHYPLDVVILRDGGRKELSRDSLPTHDLIVDVGRQTVEDYRARIAAAGSLFVNGPAGIYEQEAAAYGTRALWQAISAADGFTVIGGGDSIAAARQFDLLDGFSYVCTAGGGLVRFLAGEPMAVVMALAGAAERYGSEVSK